MMRRQETRFVTLKMSLLTFWKISCLFIPQEMSYPMDRPKLGYAIIINNVQRELPESEMDVKALQAAYREVGFDVEVYINCTGKVCWK